MAKETISKSKVTKQYTNAADNITITGSSNTISTMGGKDTITLSKGKSNKIYGGAGADTITIAKTMAGTKNYIYGDAGNDTMNVNGGSSNYIYGGAGADTITIAKTMAGTKNKIYGEAGDDKITVNGGSSNYIYGGAGADTITVASTAGNSNKIYGEAGADRITIGGGTQTVDAGADGDTITVNGGNKHTLRGGYGSDNYIINSAISSGTSLTINQSDYKSKDADTLTLSKVKKADVSYDLLNGKLTIKHTSGGTITVSGWDVNPFSKIVFKDGSVTGAAVTKSAVTKVVDWALGSKVTINATTLRTTLQINGYKDNDFTVTLNAKGQLVLSDAQGGALTITNWSKNTLSKVVFKAGSYTKTYTAAQFGKQIFNTVTLANATGEQLVYNSGTNERQEFDIAFSENTNIVIDSASNTEDRIRFTNNWTSSREDLFVSGNDLFLKNWDPEQLKDIDGQIVIKDYMTSSVKTIEFANQTYHLITQSGAYATSDTIRDRYVFLDGVKSGTDTDTPDWNVTLEGLTSQDVIDLRSLPNNSRYYGLYDTFDGEDLLLTHKYSAYNNENIMETQVLGTIRLKNFFNADGTVNTANGYPLVRINREFYAGYTASGTFDGWVWNRIRGASEQEEKYYRWLYVNAGTKNADTVNLGDLEKVNSNYHWLYYAGAGNDTVTAQAGDIVYGGNGNDTLYAQGRMSDIHGNGGDDKIVVRGADNKNLDHVVVRGEAGNDTIEAYGSYHYLNGGDGDDIIHIWSDANSDEVSHNNAVAGSSGNDTIYIHAGYAHRANGNKGNDTIYAYRGSNHALNGGDGDDEIHIIDNGEQIYTNNRATGGNGDDRLYIENGGHGHYLFGNAGDDYLSVDGNENYLDGGEGEDTLTVAGGNDNALCGGYGSDTYVVNSEFDEDTRIVINQYDYEDGDTDILQLASVNKGDVDYALEDGVLTITHSSGGTVTVEGWDENPLAEIQFAGEETVTLDEINEYLNPEVVTQQTVMRKFMKSLDDSNVIMESVGTALDTAVAFASNNVFSSWDGLIDSFVNEVKNFGATTIQQTEEFLAAYCGIDLANDDTGAITGADAGGDTIKTAISIVPEEGTMADAIAPTEETTTINGLTLVWPSEALNEKEQVVANAINTWWIKEGLNLVEESYGLSFNETGTTVSEMKVEFYTEEASSTLAAVYNSSYTNGEHAGEATALWLKINMAKFEDMDLTDVNGYAGETSGYLDRTIAHELTHAVMAANITGFKQLPDSIKEGSAELVHGIDDFRASNIRALALSANSETLATALTNNASQSGTLYADSYSAGYMLLRYFAKQVADSLNDTEVSSSPMLADFNTDALYAFSSDSASSINDASRTDSGIGAGTLFAVSTDLTDSKVTEFSAYQSDKKNGLNFA